MFYNRDLTWLSFNYRVLQEAACTQVPLYERLKFLAIFSSNLDEFFRVRYPAIIAFSKLDKKTIRKTDLHKEEALAEQVQKTIHAHLNEFGRILLQDIIPGLEENNVNFYYNKPLLPLHYEEIKEIFLSKALSFIQPVILGAGTAYSFMPENNQLYFVVTIKDKHKDIINNVIVNIPTQKLQRFYTLTPVDGVQQVVFLDDIIRQNFDLLFAGQEIISAYSIKFNLDAGIKLGDDYSGKLLDKIEKQIAKRAEGDTSRFLYENGMPQNLKLFLAATFKVSVSDTFEGSRYHNLSDLMGFPSFDKSLQYKKQPPILCPPVGDIFAEISKQDLLLHLPYHSYAPVLTFFNQAAIDADVTEIYVSLYRVAKESHIVNALISAAKNGKKVTAIIELKARFDESNNIKWSREMKKAGVKLIYSEAYIKVHSKIALVKKRNEGVESAFGIVATGNFNESTASFYTDHLLMTASEPVCNELGRLFEFLRSKKTTVNKKREMFSELFVAKFNLVQDFEKLINLEIKKAKAGAPALIRIKVNNLEEEYFIKLLYTAAEAGVTINLLVRSICCIVPSHVPGGFITVKRIVDKYLEHSRVFIFGAGEDATVAMGSSDLMTRNLRRRIEVCLDVKQDSCRKQLIDYFEMQWSDNTKATTMLGELEHSKPANGPGVKAQQLIYEYVQRLTC